MSSLKSLCARRIAVSLYKFSDIRELRSELPVSLYDYLYREGQKGLEFPEASFCRTVLMGVNYVDPPPNFLFGDITDFFKINVNNSSEFIQWLGDSCVCEYIPEHNMHMLEVNYQMDGKTYDLCINCLKLKVLMEGIPESPVYVIMGHRKFTNNLLLENTVKAFYSRWCNLCKRTPMFEILTGENCMLRNFSIHRDFGRSPELSWMPRIEHDVCWYRRIRVLWYT